MHAGFFRGTSAEQDNRFSNKQKKLLKQLKFAECLEKKVDMSKVNLEVIKPWITKRVTEILGFEDDVVIEFIFNQLEKAMATHSSTLVWKILWTEDPMDGVARSQTQLSDFNFRFSLSCIGEGNGNPLQCSCLENPRDGGAW
uniref:PWI domain-containing protein n=1 Tax=Capra hircus TaxID=9925 RepID=A0A452FHU6_CAPHI